MATVLVVDHERRIRKWIRDSLGKCGYDVEETADGQTALETASRRHFDLILLDDALPKMDGWQVLTKLKEDSQMQKIPVVVLTSFPSVETEATGMRLGAAHVLAKPCRTEALETTVRVAIREAERDGAPIPAREVEAEEVDAPSGPKVASAAPEFIKTGGKLAALERALRGGLPTGSLTLVEGVSGAGKSVLCQYLFYGSILDGLGAAYFSNQYTAGSLAKQMQSVGLNVLDHIREDHLCVYPLRERSADDDPDSLLAQLASEIQGLPQEYRFIIVDGITNLAQVSQDRAVMGFFSSCQQQCDEGRTIVLVGRTSAFDQNLLVRLHGMCNAHISLVMETITGRILTTLEVTKVKNFEPNSDNRFSFQVEADVGINIVPVSRIKA